MRYTLQPFSFIFCLLGIYLMMSFMMSCETRVPTSLYTLKLKKKLVLSESFSLPQLPMVTRSDMSPSHFALAANCRKVHVG